MEGVWAPLPQSRGAQWADTLHGREWALLCRAVPCGVLCAGVYNTTGVDAGAPSFTLSSTSLDITAFAVSLLLVFR